VTVLGVTMPGSGAGRGEAFAVGAVLSMLIVVLRAVAAWRKWAGTRKTTA
jgi:hypothetical protein